ncbi:MAG TPA: flagellar biosynthesis anti-sigma factor FlgM [Dictyobacter sp.]|jgi:anti-sigma28 factor (negative regulator of flagellin synthesis)|nr:flagellar biosynthesis anti-sigma factor FlgM [Dictyobacter sp.]
MKAQRKTVPVLEHLSAVSHEATHYQTEFSSVAEVALARREGSVRSEVLPLAWIHRQRRAARIERLRGEVEARTYTVDSKSLAHRMLTMPVMDA